MTVKVNGVTVNLGGIDYVIPPLSLGALEQLQDKIGGIQGDGNVNDVKQVSTVIDCALAALKRNYPEMTREQVADLIDLSNMQDVFRAVMNVSGMVQTQGGEESGEATAAG